uniref:Uncharacterized protein n=1 Tax=Meloidogyne incognita TaxID=6306 RepID=A0A914MZL5_MELIC
MPPTNSTKISKELNMPPTNSPVSSQKVDVLQKNNSINEQSKPDNQATIDRLPVDDALVEQPIEKLPLITTTSLNLLQSLPTTTNLRASANQLVEDVDRLLNCINSPKAEIQEVVQRFSNSFQQFSSIISDLAELQDERRIQSSLDSLINIHDEKIELLDKFTCLQADKSNISLSQALSTYCRQFSQNIWALVELVECDQKGAQVLEESISAIDLAVKVQNLKLVYPEMAFGASSALTRENLSSSVMKKGDRKAIFSNQIRFR